MHGSPVSCAALRSCSSRPIWTRGNSFCGKLPPLEASALRQEGEHEEEQEQEGQEGQKEQEEQEGQEEQEEHERVGQEGQEARWRTRGHNSPLWQVVRPPAPPRSYPHTVLHQIDFSFAPGTSSPSVVCARPCPPRCAAPRPCSDRCRVENHHFSPPHTFVDNVVMSTSWCCSRRQHRNPEPPSAIESALYSGRGTRRGAHHQPDKRRPMIHEADDTRTAKKAKTAAKHEQKKGI